MKLRSPLARVKGLGSAKTGVQHWWLQRLTGLALVPLSVWFVASLVCVAGADYDTAAQWLRSPLSALLMLLLIYGIFHHGLLGMQVVIEDYVATPWLRLTSLIAMRFALVVLGLAAALAVLRLFLGV